MSIAEKLTTIAENEQKVFDAGKKAEYDKWWDTLQPNDDLYGYTYSFYKWSRNIFFPKKNLICSSCTSMFQFFEQRNTEPFDLAARLEECGKVLDTSNVSSANGMNYSFYWTSFSRIPHIDLSSFTGSALNTFGYNGHLETIDKITSNEKIVWNNTFYTSNPVPTMPLKNIVFDGVIGQNIDFQYCPLLTHDSLISIINALKDYSGTGTTRTLILHKDAKAKLSESEIAVATQKGWTVA